MLHDDGHEIVVDQLCIRVSSFSAPSRSSKTYTVCFIVNMEAVYQIPLEIFLLLPAAFPKARKHIDHGNILFLSDFTDGLRVLCRHVEETIHRSRRCTCSQVGCPLEGVHGWRCEEYNPCFRRVVF